MSKTVAGIFTERSHAENAARQVKDQGLRTDDISIVSRQNGDTGGEGASFENRQQVNDNISDGVVSGGVLGGVTGFLIGAGTMVIPGLGIIAAAGPIAGLLSGAVTGGIVGGLVDLGIPEKKSKEYEHEVRQGRVLFSMKTDGDKAERIASILKSNGATSADIY